MSRKIISVHIKNQNSSAISNYHTSLVLRSVLRSTARTSFCSASTSPFKTFSLKIQSKCIMFYFLPHFVIFVTVFPLIYLPLKYN
jgi:hypothetical protein